MAELVMGQNGGVVADIGYLYHNNEKVSLLNTIYSMLPREEYLNPQDVNITIFNSNSM